MRSGFPVCFLGDQSSVGTDIDKQRTPLARQKKTPYREQQIGDNVCATRLTQLKFGASKTVTRRS